MGFRSTKTYGHEVGLSCCFRQWRAESHCNLLHGYALSVKLEFAATHLDDRNWVMDFGGLKPIKKMLEDTFDHTLVIARDDPHLPLFKQMQEAKICKLVVISHVGCEAFARHIGLFVQQWLNDHPTNKEMPRVWLTQCEVREHGANSAIWSRE